MNLFQQSISSSSWWTLQCKIIQTLPDKHHLEEIQLLRMNITWKKKNKNNSASFWWHRTWQDISASCWSRCLGKTIQPPSDEPHLAKHSSSVLWVLQCKTIQPLSDKHYLERYSTSSDEHHLKKKKNINDIYMTWQDISAPCWSRCLGKTIQPPPDEPLLAKQYILFLINITV